MQKYLPSIFLILIAVAITFLVSLIVPENQFRPYRLDLDSTWAKESDRQDYLVDINNDGENEIIRHDHINKPGHSLELIYHHQVSVIGIFGEKAFIVSQSLKFADVNHDGIKEMIFIAVSDHVAGLFIMEFDFKTTGKPPVPKFNQMDIDSVSYQNNVPDVVNYEILTDKSEIYFDLQAGYSVQPRNIYKYEFQSKKLIKTSRNSIVNKQLELLAYQNRTFLLAKKVVVTANTWSYEQAKIFSTAKNPDSLKIYQKIKPNIYQFGDFSSYTLLFNSNLEFTFQPVEFHGWTNYTLSGFLWTDSVPHIISLTNNQINDTAQRKITLCNLHGKILKQIPAVENFENLFTDRDQVAFFANGNLNVFTSELILEKRINGFSFVSGFYDLTPNPEREFIGFDKNELVVYSENFKSKTSLNISQEFTPYPENNRLEIVKNSKNCSILFNSRLFYYKFCYKKNELAWLKYPFYAGVFLFWFSVFFLLLRFNSMRLKKEKQYLEGIVSERTRELQFKNIELASQKEEIQTQAEKISQQYFHLEKLDHFKETLTHALVHDLKNPISQILFHTNNPVINQSARKMMRMVTNILDVEKYENADFHLNKELCSLRNICEEVRSGNEMTLTDKNLRLQFLFDDFLIMVDKEVMLRVFDNLISNAIRYSPLNRSIDVFAEKTGADLIQIDIKNYGAHISNDAMPFIFDKYRYFGNSDSSTHRSTGLGLTFCKMAVEAHGGNICARNNPDEGCSFLLTLEHSSASGEAEETVTTVVDFTGRLQFTDTEYKILKQAVKQIKNFKIFEISRFHEVLDPLKETAGYNINEWISGLFCAINIQNMQEYNRLINLVENEQA